MTTTRWLFTILLLAVLLRVGVAVYLGDTTPPAKDETSYSTLAYRLATGHGYSFPVAWYPFAPADAPTSHWSFLYTAFAAAIYAVTGFHPLAVRLVEAVLAGLLMPWLTFRLARRALAPLPPSTIDHRQLAINHSLPLIAAFLSAIYAYFVLYGAMVQTETFFICALLWSLERSLALAAALGAPQPAGSSFRMARPTLVAALTLGLSLGIATLLRQSILPWAPVLFVWLLFTAWVHSRQPAAQPSAGKNPRHLWLVPALLALFVAGLVLLASILPFTVRNYRAYGDFLLLNSNAGYAMYSAQHPLHGTDFQAYAAAPLPTDLNPIPQNEAQWDRVLMAHGIQFVLAEPGRYLLLSLSRVQDYLEFWPKDSSSFLFNLGRMLSFALLLPFMLYGIWLALRDETRRARAAGWGVFWTSGTIFLLLFALFYSVLHILTWAMPRYRLPVDAVLLIFAARGLADLAQRLATRRKSHHLPQSTQTSH